MISWLRSRLLAVTWLASLGAGVLGRGLWGRVRGGRAGGEGPSAVVGCSLGAGSPAPRLLLCPG